MHRFQTIRLLSALALLTMMVFSGTGYAQSKAKLERYRLQDSQTLSNDALTLIRQTVSPENLEARTREILAVDNLAVGERTYINGRPKIHLYIDDVLKELEPYGVREVANIKGEVAAPTPLYKRLRPDTRTEIATVTVNDKQLDVYPLWPNGAQPTLTPEQGLTGPLLWAGDVTWDELNGHDIKGRIVVINFAAGRRFERLFSMGAQAVIVVEDERMNTKLAESLFMGTPVPFPRFFMPRENADELIEFAKQNSRNELNDADKPLVQATLKGGQVFENRPYEARFIYLPPTAPLKIQIAEDELLRRIARDNNSQVEAIREETRKRGGGELTGPALKEGDLVYIPDEDEAYKVTANDLLDRICNYYQVTQEELMQANAESLGKGEFPVGELVIPNLKKTVSIMLPIDSVSVVPGVEHGGKTASNLALALLLLETLAKHPEQNRRQGLIIGLLDAEKLGGASSRAVAEAWLQSTERLEPTTVATGRRFKVSLALIFTGIGFFFGALPAIYFLFKMPKEERDLRAICRTFFSNCVIFASLFGLGAIIVQSQLTTRQMVTIDEQDHVRYDSVLVYLKKRGLEIDKLSGHATVSEEVIDTNQLIKDVDGTMEVEGLEDEAIADWFAQTWLNNYIETARVRIVELRDESRINYEQLIDDGNIDFNTLPEDQQKEALRLRANQMRYDLLKEYIVAIRGLTIDERGVLTSKYSNAIKAQTFLDIIQARARINDAYKDPERPELTFEDLIIEKMQAQGAFKTLETEAQISATGEAGRLDQAKIDEIKAIVSKENLPNLPRKVGLNYEQLVDDFAMEYYEVNLTRIQTEHNILQVQTLMGYLHPEVAVDLVNPPVSIDENAVVQSLPIDPDNLPRLKEANDETSARNWSPGQVSLSYYLSLSDGYDSICIPVAGNFRGKYGLQKDMDKLAKRWQRNLKTKDRRENIKRDIPALLRADDSITYPVMPFKDPPMYWDFWLTGSVALTPIGTANDTETRLDTPLDWPDHMNFNNLSTVAGNAMWLIKLSLEVPSEAKLPGKGSVKTPTFGRLIGKTLQFNIRSGLDAKEPVGGVYVFAPLSVSDNPSNQIAYRGARTPAVVISQLNGNWKMPLMSMRFQSSSNPVIYGFRLDQETGLFDRVVNQGQIGTQKKSPAYTLYPGSDRERNLIMTRGYPWVFFPEPDPVDYQEAGESGQTVSVINALTDAEPDNYALFNPKSDFKESDVLSNIVYMEPGKQVRVTITSGPFNRMFLTGPLQYTDERTGEQVEMPKGYGYPVGPLDDSSLPAWEQSNIGLYDTTYFVAKDMYRSADRRYSVLTDYNIKDPSVDEAINLAQSKLETVETAKANKDWRQMTGASRETWGTLEKYYPSILKLGREAVFSAVLLMALLAPCSFFLEKLIIGAKAILKRLLGVIIIFIIGTIMLGLLHPAFQIAVDPFILMVAFGMILMSLVVLIISYQRFEVIVRRARTAGGEVEADKISLGSSLATALSLGVSNLKKRPTRTWLTAFTVTVLTFSIITFVSVRGTDAPLEKPIQLEAQIEGEPVDALSPNYSGALFREYQWRGVPGGLVSSIESEFGSHFPVVIRADYLDVRGGNNANREGANQIQLTLNSDASPVKSLTMEDAEDQTDLDWQLSKADIMDWSALVTLLVNRENNPLRRFWSKLDFDAQKLIEEIAAGKAWKDEDYHQLLNTFNEVLSRPDFYDSVDYRSVKIDKELINAIPTAEGDALGIINRQIFDILFSKPANRQFVINGIMGYQPHETEFSGLNQAVTNQTWFTEEDRYHVILPSIAASELGITPDMLVDAKGQRLPDDQLPMIQMRNLQWSVIGIIDVDHANRIRDIHGKSMAMVDYLTSAFSPSTGLIDDLVNEPESYHYDWRRLVIVPYAARGDLELLVSSVALRFNSKQDEDKFYSEVAKRMNRSVYASRAEYGDNGAVSNVKISIVSSQTKQSIGGLAKIIVPVILCILIVTNTMLGNVEERKGEVGMLGAVGLSPRQISFLLLSESAVFSVLGIVFGLMSGLIFAWLTNLTGFMDALSVNFTSLISMLLDLGAGVVVLIATLIPARKAAALAAPSGMASWKLPEPDANANIVFRLPFTLTRGNAIGMMTFFRQFLLNHNDAASEDFNCRDVEISIEKDDIPALLITGHMWLAPYDLDVAQNMEMRVCATENPGVFAVDLTLKRSSGSEEAWVRVNYGFMNLVREQFLLWRNLTQEMRGNYIDQGAELFKEAERSHG